MAGVDVTVGIIKESFHIKVQSTILSKKKNYIILEFIAKDNFRVLLNN